MLRLDLQWFTIDFSLISLCNSYNMGCPPERGDNPRALEWIVLRTGGQTWYNYFIPRTSVKTLHITIYFVLKLVRVVISFVYFHLLNFIKLKH